MQRLWSAEELLARWSLMPADMELLADFAGAGKLGLAAQLAFWRQQGRFRVTPVTALAVERFTASDPAAAECYPMAVSRLRVSLSRRRDGDQAPGSAQVVGHCGEPDLQAGFGQAKPAHPA